MKTASLGRGWWLGRYASSVANRVCRLWPHLIFGGFITYLIWYGFYRLYGHRLEGTVLLGVIAVFAWAAGRNR